MQLECALTTFPLGELLDLCVRAGVAGAVEVDTPQGCHRVFVRSGRIYHAESPRQVGFDAFWPLFSLADGQFRFRHGLNSREHTIDERPSALIGRARRLAAEWQTICPTIASFDVVPELLVPEDLPTVRLDEEHWTVLSLADGVRTIREIAGEAFVEPIDACRILVRLHQRGLVRLERERTRQSPAAATPDQPAVVGATGELRDASYFARLLPAQQVTGAFELGPMNERKAQVDAILRVLGTR